MERVDQRAIVVERVAVGRQRFCRARQPSLNVGLTFAPALAQPCRQHGRRNLQHQRQQLLAVVLAHDWQMQT
ncbi:hypothetical protein E05_43010 [Plautia stali symbiont]|nr:hypothetical protein E05_43010 [Plautia stali symbiont]